MLNPRQHPEWRERLGNRRDATDEPDFWATMAIAQMMEDRYEDDMELNPREIIKEGDLFRSLRS